MSNHLLPEEEPERLKKLFWVDFREEGYSVGFCKLMAKPNGVLLPQARIWGDSYTGYRAKVRLIDGSIIEGFNRNKPGIMNWAVMQWEYGRISR